MSTITERTSARVLLHPDCHRDGGRPHHPAEESARVQVSTIAIPGEHRVFALY